MARLNRKIGIVTGSESRIDQVTGQVSATHLVKRSAAVAISNCKGPATESVARRLKEGELFAVTATTDHRHLRGLSCPLLRTKVGRSFLGARRGIFQMLAPDGGVMINTSAGTVLSGELARPLYGTSKEAIVGMARNIPTQYGKQGESFDGYDAIGHPHTQGNCDDSTRGAKVSVAPHSAAGRQAPRRDCQPHGLSCAQ
jgi:hypothetical protein